MKRMIVSLAAVLALACRSEPEPTSVGKPAPSVEQPEPEHHPIRHACLGFEAALAEGTPSDRLLSVSARHAIEFGGPEVERMTAHWALLPPQGLLELIDRYEQEANPDPQQCAGLRAHLDFMSQRSATH